MHKVCDIALSVFSQEPALRLAPMTSRLVQLAIVDVLFVATAMHDFSATRERLDRVKRSLVEKRY
jgi:DNA-binding MurR/RpiR family transcriptional regulator